MNTFVTRIRGTGTHLVTNVLGTGGHHSGAVENLLTVSLAIGLEPVVGERETKVTRVAHRRRISDVSPCACASKTRKAS